MAAAPARTVPQPVPDPGRGPRPPRLRTHTGGRSANPPAGERPPEQPEKGTRVVLGDRHGTVMPYEPEWSHGGFPVKFDDKQWRI